MTSHKKILLITDQHFGVRNDNQVFIEKYREFYTTIVLPYIRKHKIDTVLCLGDTFDKRKSINVLSLEAAREMWFDPIRELGVKMYMLIGNHDIYYKNTLKINAPQHLLSGYDNIEIIDEPKHIVINDKKILMLPWICDDNREKSNSLIEQSDATVCLGHLELTGFEAIPGRFMENGDDPSVYDKFDLVCSGHFHHKSKKGVVNYLGNPNQIYWNDYGLNRGFHILNTDTLRLQFHKNPYTIFNKLYYDDVQKEYETLPDFSRLKGSYVKVIVQQRTNQVWFDRYIKSLQDTNVADLKIIEDLTLDLDDVDESLETEDTMTILETYVQDLEDSIDKTSVVTILKSLYTEALNL